MENRSPVCQFHMSCQQQPGDQQRAEEMQTEGESLEPTHWEQGLSPVSPHHFHLAAGSNSQDPRLHSDLGVIQTQTLLPQALAGAVG